MRKVKIKSLPKAGSGLEVKLSAGLGYNSNTMPWPIMAGKLSQPDIEVNNTLSPVNREDANLEAELGETAFTDKVGDGIPQLYKIGGERHYNGGTPLNLPDDSFIFSRDNKMKIGGDILNSFGKPKGTKDKYTPADLSKQYDINSFRKVLADSDTDKIQRETAERMIANYNLKLGKLGLVQESKKGFPDGIPAISMPYLEMLQVDPSQFVSPQGAPDQPDADNVAKYGKTLRKAQSGIPVNESKGWYNPNEDWKGNTLNFLTETLNTPEKALTYLAGIPTYLGSGLKDYAAPRYELPSEYYARLADPFRDVRYDTEPGESWVSALGNPNIPKLNTGTALTVDVGLDPATWLGVSGVTKATGEGLVATGKAAKASKEFIATYGAILPDLIGLYGAKAVDAASKYGKAGYEMLKKAKISNVVDRVVPVIGKINNELKEENNSAPSPYSNIPISATTLNSAPANIPSKVQAPVSTPFQVGENTYAPKSYEERLDSIKKARNIKKYGGSLEEYSGGGGIKHQDKDFIEYNDGSIFDMHTRNWVPGTETKDETDVSPTKKSSSGTNKKIAPYGVDPEVIKILDKFKTSKSLYDQTIGHQSKTDKGYGEAITEDEWRKDNPTFVSQYEKEHGKFDINDPSALAEYEKWHYKDTYDKIYNQSKKINPNISDTEAKANAKRVADNLSFGGKEGDVNYADKKFGEFHRSRKELAFPEIDKPEVKTSSDETKTETKTDFPEYDIKNYKTPPAEWWRQDQIKTAGAFGDLMRIKKYQPWQATPGVAYGERTFYDPTRELAANMEGMNQGIQGASTFSGPQGFAATAGYLQGQGAKNAADIMGRYNNLNVTASNQLSDMNTDIFNRASQQRAQNATGLYDKQTIANQQFDNSKNLARQNLRQSYIDAITNRANTYNLNTLYPQYAISPITGGMAYNIPDSNRALNKNKTASQTPESIYKALRDAGYSNDDIKVMNNFKDQNTTQPGFQGYTSYPGVS